MTQMQMHAWTWVRDQGQVCQNYQKVPNNWLGHHIHLERCLTTTGMGICLVVLKVLTFENNDIFN